MKKNNNKNLVLRMVGKLAEKETKKDSYWWPPACAGFLHQPKRPTKK